MKLNAWSAELRERLYGPRTNKDAGGSASPSQGDFKDTLTSLRYHLDAIGENLSAVSQYLFS